MGIAGSPAIFQEKMSDLMRQLEFVRRYLDDLLMFSKSNFSDHLEKLNRVLARLRDTGLWVNVEKSKFAATECEYLRYRLTQEGIKSQPEKVAAILALEPYSL